MAKLRIPMAASTVLGMTVIVMLLGVVTIWPETASAQDKPLLPSVQPAQPPATTPPVLFGPKKEVIKPGTQPVQPPPFGPPSVPGVGPGGPPSKEDVIKQRQLEELRVREAELVAKERIMVMTKIAMKRFHFNIDPKTPLEDLLPRAPKDRGISGPLLSDDLTKVPEVTFEQVTNLPAAKALEHNAHTIAKINHINQKKTDSFMEALLGKRADLAGLPFAMGDDCRIKGDRSRQFKIALATVRGALGQQVMIQNGSIIVPTQSGPGTSTPQSKAVILNVPGSAEQFWDRFQASCIQQDKANAKCDPPHQEHVTVARVAALMQMLGPEPASMRKGLVKHLAGISHVEATKALAKLAIFSPETDVRQTAIDALKVRRERDYTAILLAGLHYPFPAVAERAGQAIVKLERNDLAGQLVALLDEPDPRLPVVKTVQKKQVPVVREVVRINHHRNCLLCHAPGNTPSVSADVVTAPVPTPGEPFPSPSEGYGSFQQPDTLVRIDVTYLRQDFSMFQPVADAHPWPETQRFDFLVRNRELTEEEAAVYQEKLGKREPGELSPYHRTALAALRDLTGRDTEPTAQAWRKLLTLSK